MESFPLLNKRKLEYFAKLPPRSDNNHRNSDFRCFNHSSKKELLQYDKKLVNKRKGISINKCVRTHFGYKDDNSGVEFYRSDSESFTPMDNLDLEIDENVLRVCKIYLKRSLFNDCKLVKLNTNYVEHIVDLIFNLGFFAKKRHFRRDILDLIHLIEVPEPMLHLLEMNRNHRLSIFKGVALKSNLTHPDMPRKLNRCKVLLLKHFSSIEDESHLETYDTIASMANSIGSLVSLIDKIITHGVKIVISENHISYDIAALLAKRNICCLSKVGHETMSKLAFALNCGVLYSLDSESKLNKYIGICDKFRLFQSGFSIATLTLPEWFKGFTILISSRMIKSENLNRIRELIKISIVRLQGIVEELEFIDNLNGKFIVDTTVFDSDFEDNNDICENFSDYLDMVLCNTTRSSVSSSSPRSNLNYFSCDIYYNKIVESEISCNEYRKLTRLQCFQYYTRINELCVKPTFDTIPIGNYLDGLFFSDFVSRITNSLKINKCVVNPNCSESFINHQLHFETAYSNIENMRLSLTFQMSSEKYDQDGINVKTFCTVCNLSQIHKVQDLTFGRFLQLMLFNRSYRSKCDHILFYNNKFSVLADNYSISFNLSPVSIYTVVPEFNEPNYNCSMDTLPFRLNYNTVFDKRLKILSNKVINLVHNLEYGFVEVKISTCRVFINLYFDCKNTFTQSLSYFHNKVFENVKSNFHNLLSYDIELHLPCLCQLSRAYSPNYLDRNQWLCSIKNLTFDEFKYKYEKHSAFGIEINYRLNEKLKNYFETGHGLHICESCGLDSYTTLADIDLLNWFYILVHVIKAFESKIVKLKAGLSQVMRYSRDIDKFYHSILRTEENLLGVFMQCVSLLIYSRFFCPRDPLYLFTILKTFFVSFFNLFEELLYDYADISHLDQVSGFKILEYDKSHIIIYHSFCDNKPIYEKIDFINKTSEYVTPFGDEDDLLETKKNNKTKKIKNSFDLDLYQIYSIDEFLTLSQYFAILSGIQDLARTNVSAPKSSYFKLISKIRTKNIGNQSIICPNYTPIIQPTRDVSNIISNVLVTRRYIESFKSQRICIRMKEYTRKYIEYLKESEINNKYEPYRFEDNFGDSGHHEFNKYLGSYGSLGIISSLDCVDYKVRKVGLFFNYVSILSMKRSNSRYLFKKKKNINNNSSNNDKENTGKESPNDDDTKEEPLKVDKCELMDRGCQLMKIYGDNQIEVEISENTKERSFIPHCQLDSPFYGLPVVYTNSKILNYNRINNSNEKIIRKVDREIFLSGKLVEKCFMFNVDYKLVVKNVLKACYSSMVNLFYKKFDSNWLSSLVGILGKGKMKDFVGSTYLYINKGFVDFCCPGNFDQIKWNFDSNFYVGNFESLNNGNYVNLIYFTKNFDDLSNVNMNNTVNLIGGNNNSNSSVSNEFEVILGPYCITVYYPVEFHSLRHKFCGDDMNFIRSLIRCTRMPSIGKSGSPIFMTYDGKFTLKIINKHEMSLFVSQGFEIFKYFEKNDTLMSLPYGLFKVRHPKTNTSVNLFVMQNIDYFHHSWKVSFDLKGISLRRYVSLSQDYVISFNSNPVVVYINGLTFNHGYSLFRKESISDGSTNLKNGNCVLLDQNFKLYTKGCPIQLDYDSITTINNRLKSDLEFLSSINIVDYSLLLRILPSESVITLGLIDFLRPYTWDKQIETVGKRLANIGQAPTIVSPNEYKTRFSSFMQKIFIYPYPSKSSKESREIVSLQQVQSEGIDFNYHMKSYTKCSLCKILKYIYSNSYFTCLKFYMTLMSPEVMQYLHLLLSRQYPEILLAINKSSMTQDCFSGSWKINSLGNTKENDKSNNQGLEDIISLIEHLYQSPVINWNCV